MNVYLLFIRGTLYGVFKTEEMAYEYLSNLPDEAERQDAWIVCEDVQDEMV